MVTDIDNNPTREAPVPGDVHDQMFRDFFSDTTHFAALAQFALRGDELGKRLQWSTLCIEKDVFTDANFPETSLVLVFSVQCKSAIGMIPTYIVVVNKTIQETGTIEQIAKYMHHLNLRQLQTSEYCIVTSILIYHGQMPDWTLPVQYICMATAGRSGLV